MNSEIAHIIDTKIHETIHTDFYGALARYLGADEELATQIKQAVHTGARIVMFWDRYVEIGDEAYLEASLQSRTDLIEICPALNRELLSTYCESTIGPFWEYEQSLLDRAPHSPNDREHYSIMKSSDVPFYLSIAEMFIPIPEKYKQAFRALQRINDVYDDLIDLGEDIAEGSPNLVLLFSREYTSVSDLTSENISEIYNRINPLVDMVIACEELPFLGHMARQYKSDIDDILVRESRN